MNLPANLHIRLAMLHGPQGNTAAFVIAAPAPVEASLSLFGRKHGMSGAVTHDAGMSWPDSKGKQAAGAMLGAGQPVAFGFASMADALGCHRRSVRETAR